MDNGAGSLELARTGYREIVGVFKDIEINFYSNGSPNERKPAS